MTTCDVMPLTARLTRKNEAVGWVEVLGVIDTDSKLCTCTGNRLQKPDPIDLCNVCGFGSFRVNHGSNIVGISQLWHQAGRPDILGGTRVTDDDTLYFWRSFISFDCPRIIVQGTGTCWSGPVSATRSSTLGVSTIKIFRSLHVWVSATVCLNPTIHWYRRRVRAMSYNKQHNKHSHTASPYS